MKKSLISIIIPFFNRADLLEETIESVLAQTSSDWELILVDDGSTDGSDLIANKYSLLNNRILNIKRDREPKGAPGCRNIGAEKANGDFLFFLDSDDLLPPWAIEQRLEAVLSNPELDWLAFPMILFKEKTDDMKILLNIKTQEDDLLRFLRRENVWIHPLWRKSFFIEILKGFNSNCLSYQDWEINVRALTISNNYEFFDKMKPDVFYRQHENTISSNRYSSEHNASNANMILTIFDFLKKHNNVNEEGRRSLVRFFVDVLLRYRFLKECNSFDSAIKKKLEDAFNSGLLKRSEIARIFCYFKLNTFKLAYHSKVYRKSVEIIFRKFLLKAFYVQYNSNQLKHKYEGALT